MFNPCVEMRSCDRRLCCAIGGILFYTEAVSDVFPDLVLRARRIEHYENYHDY